MGLITDYVNSRARCRVGRLPKSNRVVQAFAAALILRDQLLGIRTAVAAAAWTGVSLPSVRAATEILEYPDLALAVLKGHEPLLRTATKIRNRVRLIAGFKKATPEDLIALTHAIGAATLLNTAIIPAGGLSVDEALTIAISIEAGTVETNGAAVLAAL
jgi:hypothetical protein